MEIKVLDHGYVRLVTSWGSDEGIVETARVSTNKGFLGWGPHHTEECARAKHDRQWVLAASNEAADPGNDPPACDCAAKPGDEKLLSFLLRCTTIRRSNLRVYSSRSRRQYFAFASGTGTAHRATPKSALATRRSPT